MTALWLADALRAGGLEVIEEPGWKTRGTGGIYQPLGVLLHHTAGPASGNLPSLNVITNGRSDLQGPLAQLMLARDGKFHVIAAGRANHAGAGSARWVPANDGNRFLVGIEAESTGVTDDWTPAQRAAYPRGAAALAKYMGVGADHVIGHKEWAPTRKIDPAFWDLNAFRAEVATYLANGFGPSTTPPARLHEEDDCMYIKCDLDGKGSIGTAILSGSIFAGLSGGSVTCADENIKKGALVQWVNPEEWADLDRKSHAVHDNPRPVRVVADERSA